MQIEFWRTDRPTEQRTSDIIVRRWQPCRPVDSEAKTSAVAMANEATISGGRRSHGERVTGIASHLWPYSAITAVVRVLNGAHCGPPSLPTVFNTTEGGRWFGIVAAKVLNNDTTKHKTRS